MPEPTALPPVVPEPKTQTPPPDPSVEPSLVEDDLVIEEVSIDGMCGVY